MNAVFLYEQRSIFTKSQNIFVTIKSSNPTRTMRFHLATAILLSVLAGSNAQQQEPERKPRPILSTAFEGNNLLSRSHKTNTYYKRKKSESPSYMPSSDPSSSPSDVPSASPSDAPSDVPSTVPSDEPSTSPSSAPSDVPSTVPSSSPSATPSTSPSDEPSTVPSSSPSATPSTSPSDEPSTVPSSSPSDEGDRVLYIGDPMTCSTKISVEEVEETLSTLQGDIDKLTIIENLEISSSTLQVMSLGLSKSIEYRTTELITEQLVADEIESTLIPLLENLSTESRENFNDLLATFSNEEKAMALYAVELMEGTRVLKEDFKSFISSRGNPNESVRQDRTIKFRKRCGAIDSKPIDMFRHVYEYGCGARDTSVACTPEDFGICQFGPKGSIHIGRLPTKLMDVFYRWISATLVEISLLHAVCLPPMTEACAIDTCINPTLDDTFTIVRDAANEVFSNVVARSNCEEGADSGLEICRINSQGFAISPRDPRYADAEPVFASDALIAQITGDETSPISVKTSLTKVEGIMTIFSTLSGAAGLAEIGSAFGGVGAAFAFAAFFLPTPNPTLDAVTQGFKKVDARLDALSAQVNQGFEAVNAKLNDITLDDFTSDLQKIKAAYSKYMTLADREVRANPSYKTLVEQYKEEFRFACNDLDLKPEDIIVELYGYACGSIDFEDVCPALSGENSVDVGICTYGTKKQDYLLEQYFKQADSVNEFRAFSAFMKGALLEALFLQSVCLPPIPDACIPENDSIRDQALQNSIAMIEEVEGNLAEIENCFCPCGYLEFERLKLPGDNGSNDADLTWLRVDLEFLDESAVTSASFTNNLAEDGVFRERNSNRNTRYYGELVDFRDTDNDISIDSEGTDIRGDIKEFLFIKGPTGSANEFFRSDNDSYKKGFPIQIMEDITVNARDNDDWGCSSVLPSWLCPGGDDDFYRGSLNLVNKINFKCGADDGKGIKVELDECNGSGEGEFTFNVIKTKSDACNQLSSTAAFCSYALPDCPNSDFYCDFSAKLCKSKISKNGSCNRSLPCKGDLQCIDGTCQEGTTIDACKIDYDCGEGEFCGPVQENENLKICKTAFNIGNECTRSAQCQDSYCNDGNPRECTAPSNRGDSCNFTDECKSGEGLTCTDNVCKDDLNEPCFSNDDCEPSSLLYCDGTVCKDRKEIGIGCALGSECKSSFCDPMDGACKNN